MQLADNWLYKKNYFEYSVLGRIFKKKFGKIYLTNFVWKLNGRHESFYK